MTVNLVNVRNVEWSFIISVPFYDVNRLLEENTVEVNNVVKACSISPNFKNKIAFPVVKPCKQKKLLSSFQTYDNIYTGENPYERSVGSLSFFTESFKFKSECVMDVCPINVEVWNSCHFCSRQSHG